jgi:nitrite reductase/ring-hydroxylating ferredoxin subunit/DMSO/TMAO reductase YedYZ heme-binding membrane subunit
MSASLVAVSWNRVKFIYDGVLLAAIGAYILIYVRLVPTLQPYARAVDDRILHMQAFGTCAFLMLTFILCLGPLARLDRRFLPLLYNRRHFGVLTAAVAATHAYYVLNWYFDDSPTDPYVAMLGSNTSYGQILGFPFEAFGIFALAILLVLAFTSHDFWLSFLTPSLWKAIHMGIYIAYAAVVLHLAFGAIQAGNNAAFAPLAIVSVAAVCFLQWWAGRREASHDGMPAAAAPETPWLLAGSLADIAPDHGFVVVVPGGERVAIFRYDGKLSALSNVCAHQNGPLGEGRVVDGCVTCPWHGFQYRPEDGCAPPPFTEKVATYRLKLDGDKVLLDPRPNPPGTRVEPVAIGGGHG